MPFTLSHPAAAIPLRRLLPWAVLPALAIGSMAPDFPYFIGLGEVRFRTHSLVSIATFSVPVGFAAYLAFERWLRTAWSDLLPEALAARIPHAAVRRSRLAVIASLTLGALTHVVWDSFTHEHEPGVRLVDALNVVVIELLGFPVRGYNLLQNGSTLVGAALLALWLRNWLRRTPRGVPPASWARMAIARRLAPSLVCGVFAPAALVFAAHSDPPGRDPASVRSFIGAAVVSGMSLTLAALFVHAAWWWRRAGCEVSRSASRSRSSPRARSASGPGSSTAPVAPSSATPS